MSEPLRTEHRITRADLGALLSGEGGVDLVPVLEDGKQSAMRVVGVKPRTMAARLGAQNGDTIERIDGVALTSVAEAYRAAELAQHQTRIVICGARGATRYETVLLLG